MKCRYCGNNIGLEDELCPFCGKENEEAAGHLAAMKNYKEDYDNTKSSVIRKSTKFNNITARIAIIAVMLLIIVIMLFINRNYSDFDIRLANDDERVHKEVEKRKSDIDATLKDMVEHRDYLAMEYFVINYQLRVENDFKEYNQVFDAAEVYESVYTKIMDIIDEKKYYDGNTQRDYCNKIAYAICGWNEFVERKQLDSVTKEEHLAFLADAKNDTQDMVQVYFKLTDEEAAEMWDMESYELANVLYERCEELYPEVTVIDPE